MEHLKLYKDEVQEVHIAFNKITGAHIGQFIGVKKEKLDTTYFKYKTLKFNPRNKRWVRDFDDGELMDYGSLRPKSDENMLNILCGGKILKKVKLYDQLNVYADMFKVLIAKGVLTEEDQGVKEFLEQREYIERALKNNKLYKEARAASDMEDYKDKRQLDKKKNDQFAGGLNVLIGRDISV